MGFGDDILQSIKDSAGIADARNNTNQDPRLPWQNAKYSKFFDAVKIDPDRWDALYPYRLLVINADTNGTILQSGPSGVDNPHISVSFGTGISTINFQAPNDTWEFRLPITPQQLSIQDIFAIQTTATLRGILEEHNGVKFKMINAQGSFGVWPQRESISLPPTSPNAVQSIFGGSLEAVGAVGGQLINAVSAFTSAHPANKPKRIGPEISTAGKFSTGYYQAMAMQQFLEQYAEAKKDPKKASWRLVFDIPKQNQSFIVTPQSFNWTQNVNKPLEINFNMQLKAWRRVNLKITPATRSTKNFAITPNLLQKILTALDSLRNILSSVMNLIASVRSDIHALFDNIRKLALIVKDLAGVVVSVCDLPGEIVKDLIGTIISSVAVIKSIGSLQDNLAKVTGTWKDINHLVEGGDVSQALAAGAGKSAEATPIGNGFTAAGTGAKAALNSDGSSAPVAAPAPPSPPSPTNAGLSQHPGVAIFDNPDAIYPILSQIPVSSLKLNFAQQRAVDKVIAQTKEASEADIKSIRAVLYEFSLQLSNSFGTGDSYFSHVYGTPAPTQRIQPISLDEYDILKHVYDVIQGCDALTATTQFDDDKKQTNMNYVAGLADLTGIPFTTTENKILAPVPFGMTIEAISMRYLKDPQRWIEIATLNNLREPYIDETGFQLPLLSNAIGRQITIASVENLYIGQRVILNSITQRPSARTILDIDRLSDTSFLLTLDQLPDLNNFTFLDKSYLQAYLPGTVNSQQKIFIPSELSAPDNPSIVPPPSTSDDPLTGLSRVDWLLTDTGDIAANNFGDFRYSSGITNIIQALRIKFGTMAGTVLLHPDFGLGVKVGTMTSEVQIQNLYNSINGMIKQDPRFQGVKDLQISLNGPTLTISVGVSIAGQNGVFPVTFTLT